MASDILYLEESIGLASGKTRDHKHAHDIHTMTEHTANGELRGTLHTDSSKDGKSIGLVLSEKMCFASHPALTPITPKPAREDQTLVKAHVFLLREEDWRERREGFDKTI